MKKIKENKGYTILSILLAVVIAIVSIGAWSLSGTTNSSKGASSSADVMASTIISQGASLQVAYDSLKIQGYSPLTSDNAIEYFPNDEVPQNILNSTTGTQVPIVPIKAVRENATAQEGFWIYEFFGLTANGVGTASGYDQTMMIMGLKDTVCQRINQNLNGTSTIPSLPVGYNVSTIITKDFPMYNGLISFNSVAAAKNWTSGCISTAPGTPDKNMYFKILQAN